MTERFNRYWTSGSALCERTAARSWLLPTLIVLAIGLRVAAVLVLRSHYVPHSTYEHGEIAENLLAGRGFSVKFLGGDGPTAQQAPLYPFCVATAYALGGVGTPQSLLGLFVAQAFLSGFLVWGTYSLTRRIIPDRPWAPLLSAGMVACYPTLVYAATHAQVALLATTLLVGVMNWAYRAAETGKLKDAAVTGVLLSLLALADPILAIGCVGVMAAIGFVRDSKRVSSSRAIGLLAVVAVISLLGVLPWIIRNYQVHGEFVAIKSSFGYAFWQGNCDLSQGTDKVVRPSVDQILERNEPSQGGGLEGLNRTLWKARHEAGYLDDIALTQEDYRMLGQVTEPERSRILFRRAINELSWHPTRYLELCARRLFAFVFFDNTNPKTRVFVYRLSHLGLTAWAFMGLIIAGSTVRKRLVPIVLAAGLITLFHALTIVSARFHIPVEPFMAIWGTAGLAGLLARREPSRAGLVSVPSELVRFGARRRLGVESSRVS